MRPHNWARYSFGPWLNSASERLHRIKLADALAKKLARIAWSVLRNAFVPDPQGRDLALNGQADPRSL
jgi:hypothetical protein